MDGFTFFLDQRPWSCFYRKLTNTSVGLPGQYYRREPETRHLTKASLSIWQYLTTSAKQKHPPGARLHQRLIIHRRAAETQKAILETETKKKQTTLLPAREPALQILEYSIAPDSSSGLQASAVKKTMQFIRNAFWWFNQGIIKRHSFCTSHRVQHAPAKIHTLSPVISVPLP